MYCWFIEMAQSRTHLHFARVVQKATGDGLQNPWIAMLVKHGLRWINCTRRSQFSEATESEGDFRSKRVKCVN